MLQHIFFSPGKEPHWPFQKYKSYCLKYSVVLWMLLSILTFEAIQVNSENWRTKRVFSPWTSLEFRLTLKHMDAGDIWIEIHFTSSSHRYCTGRASTNCFTLLPLKHLWQWNQSFRGQNCFELICIFSGTMNRRIGRDSSLHHNAWSFEPKTKRWLFSFSEEQIMRYGFQ